MWRADENGHLNAIATFTVGRGGSAAAEEVALMPTTAQWLPCRDPYAQILLDTLVKQRRRFRTTLRFLLAPEVDLPVAVLTDCHTPHGLLVRLDAPGPHAPTAPEEGPWVRDVDDPLPPLPPPVRYPHPAGSSPALDPPAPISTAPTGG